MLEEFFLFLFSLFVHKQIDLLEYLFPKHMCSNHSGSNSCCRSFGAICCKKSSNICPKSIHCIYELASHVYFCEQNIKRANLEYSPWEQLKLCTISPIKIYLIPRNNGRILLVIVKLEWKTRLYQNPSWRVWPELCWTQCKALLSPFFRWRKLPFSDCKTLTFILKSSKKWLHFSVGSGLGTLCSLIKRSIRVTLTIWKRK